MTSKRERERASESERASEEHEREREGKRERSGERESVCVRVFVLCVCERSKPSGEKCSGEVRGSGYRDDEQVCVCVRERERGKARARVRKTERECERECMCECIYFVCVRDLSHPARGVARRYEAVAIEMTSERPTMPIANSLSNTICDSGFSTPSTALIATYMYMNQHADAHTHTYRHRHTRTRV